MERKRIVSTSIDDERIVTAQYTFPFVKLPPEIFRAIAKYLRVADGKEMAIKAMFITSKVIRERYMNIFMEFLWFTLFDSQILDESMERRVENLQILSIDQLFLGRFPSLKRLNIMANADMDFPSLPRSITRLDISATQGVFIINIGHLVNLESLFVHSSQSHALTIGSSKLKTVQLYGCHLYGTVDLPQLTCLTMDNVWISTTLNLFDSLKRIEITKCLLNPGRIQFLCSGSREIKSSLHGHIDSLLHNGSIPYTK